MSIPVPTIVQAGNTYTLYHTTDGNAGPFEWNGNAYIFGYRIIAATGKFDQAAVYLTIDKGATYTQQDIVNTPVVGNNGFFSVFYPKSGGSVFYVVWNNPPNASTATSINLSSFNMATNTWTAIATGGPNLIRATNSGNPDMLLVRRSDGSFVIQMNQSDGVHPQSYYATYSGGVWSGTTLISTGYVDGNSARTALMAVTDSDVVVMQWYSFTGGTPGSMYANTLTLAGTLSAPITVYNIAGGGQVWKVGDWDALSGWNCQGRFLSTLNKIVWCVAFLTTPNTTQPTLLIADTSVSPPTFSLVTVATNQIPAVVNISQNWAVFGTNSAESQFTVAWTLSDNQNGLVARVLYSTATSLTGPWGAATVFYDEVTTPSIPAAPIIETNALSGNVLSGGLSLVIGLWSTQDAQQWFQTSFGAVQLAAAVTTPVLSAGGRGFIRFQLNLFNACLGREYLLYKLIDRELLKCGVKPACFCIDERDWGGNFSEHEEVPMGPPEGALAFNPTGQVALPTPLAGDTTIFTFRIPWGYDGVILGQYHGYFNVISAPPVPTFVEGSGDITWRLSIAGRFGRDAGNMLVSIGSSRNMSPIAGGLQVRSENIIQYIVAAPNTSGTLTPGLGNIIAGLHLWVWPRR